VYNNMPDIISHLSNAKIDEDSYRKIMRFLFELIKDKNMDSMTEKLCQRFKNTDEERGWRDIAFCLSMLPFKTEKSFKKLLEGFPNYQDKVHEEAVFKYLTDIIAKVGFDDAWPNQINLCVMEYVITFIYCINRY